MSTLVHPDVLPQLSEVELDPARPLLICDADEVLVRFMASLERFLARRELYYDWRQFDFRSTIRHVADHALVSPEEVTAIRDRFFAEEVEHLLPVPGAAAALATLAPRTQIIILTNLPLTVREARRRGLSRHGINFPVIANQGGKGPAVRHLAESVGAPVFFLDDQPQHHASVAVAAERVRRVQFIEDPRLERLLGRTEDAHHQARSWDQALGLLEGELAAAGF
ncbi:MAG: hypothetical protein EXQ85_04930 [Alphaproteobacteria bacterium]|nr:hypothetical protein [Alphaproteobacteria bacterium]